MENGDLTTYAIGYTSSNADHCDHIIVGSKAA